MAIKTMNLFKFINGQNISMCVNFTSNYLWYLNRCRLRSGELLLLRIVIYIWFHWRVLRRSQGAYRANFVHIRHRILWAPYQMSYSRRSLPHTNSLWPSGHCSTYCKVHITNLLMFLSFDPEFSKNLFPFHTLLGLQCVKSKAKMTNSKPILYVLMIIEW